MPQPTSRFSCLLFASALLSLGSGCDWGNRSLTFNRPFLETDQAVRTVLKHAPSESKDGFTQYGSEKPGHKDAIITRNASFLLWTNYTDVVVRVERKKEAETKVSVKCRESEGILILNDRDRKELAEKQLFYRIGRALGESTPFDAKVGPDLDGEDARLQELLAMDTAPLMEHLIELGGHGSRALPALPKILRGLDLEPQDDARDFLIATTVSRMCGSSAGLVHTLSLLMQKVPQRSSYATAMALTRLEPNARSELFEAIRDGGPGTFEVAAWMAFTDGEPDTDTGKLAKLRATAKTKGQDYQKVLDNVFPEEDKGEKEEEPMNHFRKALREMLRKPLLQ